MWLGSYLPAADREQLVGLLLDLHAEDAEKLKKSNEAAPPPSPNPGAADGEGGAPGPTQAEDYRSRTNLLTCCMRLLMDPSWHERIPAVQQIGSLIPPDLFSGNLAEQDETLAKAKAFAGQ